MFRYADLEKRVNKLLERLSPSREPREWHVCLEEGEQLAESLQAHLGPDDVLIIDIIPRGYFGDVPTKQHMSCWQGKQPFVISEKTA